MKVFEILLLLLDEDLRISLHPWIKSILKYPHEERLHIFHNEISDFKFLIALKCTTIFRNRCITCINILFQYLFHLFLRQTLNEWWINLLQYGKNGCLKDLNQPNLQWILYHTWSLFNSMNNSLLIDISWSISLRLNCINLTALSKTLVDFLGR